MKEREISLVDLIVEILLRWRVIIIAMLVGGVLMGGLSYVKSYRTAQMQKAQNEELKEQQIQEEPEGSRKTWLEEKLTPIQLANVETVVVNEALCKEQEEYYSHSTLMQLDADNVPYAEATFYIKGEDAASVNNLVQVYGDLVVDGEILSRLADKLELSQSAVSELVKVERTSTNNMLGSNSFCVSVICDTEERCRIALAEIMSYVEEQRTQMAEFMGEHAVSVIKQSCTITANADLMESQRTIINSIVSLKNSIAKAKDAFSDEEMDYYNFLNVGSVAVEDTESSDTDEEEKTDYIPVITPTVSVKFVILGMLLAAFLYVFVVFLQYILNTKIRSNDKLALLYDISLLGQITKESQKKKPFGFVDRLILSVRDRNKRRFSTEESTKLAAVAVKMAAEKRSLEKVYCVGCDMQKGAAKVCENLKTSLKDSSLELEVLDNVLYDAEAM